MDSYDDMEDSMVPERDAGGQHFANYPDDLLEDHGDGSMIMKTSMAAFNQQRTVVAKLSRGEIEDRYLRLLEENVVLKKHAVKQEEKIKKLATKLIRVMSDKKRLELGGPNASNLRGHHRDLETEELIEDQQQRIRELERVNNQLKDKLMVAKQQIMAVNQQNAGSNRVKRAGSTIPRSVMGLHSPQQTPSLLMASPTPMSQQQLLSQQAQNLLEEARNENRMLEESVTLLKEQVNMLELEVEQTHEQAKIKEANYEEEISLVKEQLKERSYQDVAENIELIRLQQDKKAKATQMSTLKAQIQALEEEVTKFKVDMEKLKAENSELSTNLSEEQRKAINLASELSNNSSSKQALTEAEEKMRDLQKENAILRESNAKLLDSAYNVERERQFTAAENALKVQVAQLEATLKADLNEKKLLSEALGSERESLAKMEADFQDLQSKYFNLKEAMEGHDEKLKFFAEENSIDAGELEQALLYLRQKQTGNGSSFSSKLKSGSFPEFLEHSSVGEEPENVDQLKLLRSELSQVQAHHVEAVNELEKTRSLLRVQANINQEQKNEIEALQQRLFQVKSEFQGQIGEYKKLLDMRAARIHKLEMQVRDSAYGQAKAKQIDVQNLQSHTVHTPSGQSLFEIHVQKANLTKECLLQLGENEPKIFATWTFYDHDMQYTPVIKGPQANLDCSAYYKVKLDEAFLDFLMDSSVLVELHMINDSDEQCKSIGQAELKLSEVVHYPSNKLHGSVLIHANPSSSNQRDPSIIGSLDFWFKLHTAATSRIQEWLDHRQEVEKALERCAQNSKLADSVDLLQGEQRAIQVPENQDKLVAKTKPSLEPELAPRVAPKNRPRKLMRSKGTVVADVDEKVEETETEKPPIEKEEEQPFDEKVSQASKDSLEKSKRTSSEKDSIEKLKKGSSEKETTEKSKKHSTEKEASEKSKKRSTEKSQVSSQDKAKTPEKKVIKDESKVQDDTSQSKSVEKEEEKPVPKPRGPIQVVSQVVEDPEKQKSEWDEEEIESKVIKKEEPSKKVEEEAKPIETAIEESSSEEEESEESEDESQEESAEEESGEEESEEDKEEISDKKESNDEDEEVTSSSVSKEKKLVKEDSQTTITNETSSTSHDSEGVVVRKDSLLAGSRHSVLGNEAITITVSEFKAGKNANFLKNKKIQKLFVEYSFLDLKAEETETPFALPKPKATGEAIVFNFSKVVPMDKQGQGPRRKLLTKMLKEEKSFSITFSLVSEPDESEDGKCEDVGTASVDLQALYKAEQDLTDAALDVYSVEPQTRVSKFLGSKKIIGTLTVSVIAADVFKSLKL